MKSYLIIYNSHTRRVKAKTSDDAILKFFENDHDGVLETISSDIRHDKKHCKHVMGILDQLLEKIPDIRCYELVNDELLRASPKLYNNLKSKKHLVNSELAKIAHDELQKEMKNDKEKEEIAQLKILARKYPRVINEFSERYTP